MSKEPKLMFVVVAPTLKKKFKQKTTSTIFKLDSFCEFYSSNFNSEFELKNSTSLVFDHTSLHIFEMALNPRDMQFVRQKKICTSNHTCNQ